MSDHDKNIQDAATVENVSGKPAVDAKKSEGDARSKASRSAKKPMAKKSKPASRKRAADAKPRIITVTNKTMVIGAGALVLAGLAGAGIHAVVAPGAKSSMTGQTKVDAGAVDDRIGTYTVNGRTHDVTVRDALVTTGALNPNEDGGYDVPGAEAVLTVARNKAMSAKADERGIKVSDEDISEYLKQNMGSDDLESVAGVYGYTADEMRQSVVDSIKLNRLYADVTGNENGVGESPLPPDENLSSAEYHDYIVTLAGKYYDAEKNTWAKKDGGWAKTMGDADISADGATYETANKAHKFAYDKWRNRMDEVIKLWEDFCAETYKDVTVTISNAATNLG